MTARTIVGAAALMLTTLAAGCSDDAGSDDAGLDDASAAPTDVETTEATDSASPVPEAGTVPPQTTIDDQSIGPPDPDDLNPPPMPRVCLLATDVEIADIIGQTPAAYGEANRGGVLVCRFTDAADERLATVRIVTAEGKPAPADTFASLSAAADSEPVEGFGQQAIWAEDALHVVVGDELLTFTVFPSATMTDPEGIREASTELATLVMPRYTPPTG